VKTFFGLWFVFATLGQGFASPDLFRPWRGNSDPITMSPTFIRTFASLPLNGVQGNPRRLWSSDYWALQKGNINYRWNAPRPRGFNLNSPSKARALAMSPEEISTLAASEKWDLLQGRYDYPFVRDVGTHASSSYPIWQGICHGWSPAAMNHDEPLPRTLRSADGIQVPFGSSDIKALLSYYYAYIYRAPTTHQMGRRCEESLLDEDVCYEDLNAGAFHIVLANKVGLQGTSFIADIERKAEVWNHPISDYQTQIIDAFVAPHRSSARGTVRMARVKTSMTYVYEIKKNNWNPVLGTDQQVYKKKKYEYYLDLDGVGNIIGGEWISEERPDFLWTVEATPKFTGWMTGLEALL
jgi:Transglutaminase elicitor